MKWLYFKIILSVVCARKVWAAERAAGRVAGGHNTLMIDDTYRKMREHPHNMILVRVPPHASDWFSTPAMHLYTHRGYVPCTMRAYWRRQILVL